MKSLLLIPLLLASSVLISNADTIEVNKYTFDLGDKWSSQQPSSPMRSAELVFDAEGDDDPEAAFFVFGGTVEQNISRWKGQFSAPPEEEREELDGGGVIVILSGVYLDGPPMAPASSKKPKENYRMLGAILPTEDGRLVFVKMTAPAAIADEAREPFAEMIKSGLK